jgi:hypothetical protein
MPVKNVLKIVYFLVLSFFGRMVDWAEKRKLAEKYFI